MMDTPLILHFPAQLAEMEREATGERDLLDIAGDIGDVRLELRRAARTLGRAYERNRLTHTAEAKREAIDMLIRARDTLDLLIEELGA